MGEDFAEIDISNQLDNSWNKDSVLAIKMGKIGFSIKIRDFHKKVIRKKFILDDSYKDYRRNNRRVTVILHSLLLYKLLKELPSEAFEVVKICNDVGPFVNLNKYYSKVCKYYCLTPSTKIKPRKGNGKSKAHYLANDVYNGRKKEDFLIKEKDIGEIIKIIQEFLCK